LLFTVNEIRVVPRTTKTKYHLGEETRKKERYGGNGWGGGKT